MKFIILKLKKKMKFIIIIYTPNSYCRNGSH